MEIGDPGASSMARNIHANGGEGFTSQKRILDEKRFFFSTITKFSLLCQRGDLKPLGNACT